MYYLLCVAAVDRLASIFLAGKTEQQFMAPAELISMKGAHCSAAQLMHVELVLLEGLNFDLKVFHPHNLCALIINQALEVSADEANSDDKARFEQEVLQQQIREGNVVNSEAMAVQSGADDVSTAFKKAWRDTALIHIAELMVSAWRVLVDCLSVVRFSATLLVC